MAYIASAFTAGQTLTAASMEQLRENNNYGHNVYTTEAARDAAITSPVEGMMAYLTAPTVPAATGATAIYIPSGITTIYNGSVWVCTTEVGALSAGATNTMGTSFANATVGGTTTSVTLTTGTTALISFSAKITGTGNYMQVAVKASSGTSPVNWQAAMNQSATVVVVGRTYVMTGLTAGTNTFTLQHQSNIATGTAEDLNLVVKGIA